MSIQLEIFPQEHIGFSGEYSPPPVELFSDTQTFGSQLQASLNPFGGYNQNWVIGLFNPLSPIVAGMPNSFISNVNNSLFIQDFSWVPVTWKRFRFDNMTGANGVGPSFDM